MTDNPEQMLDEVEGYSSCLLQHMDNDGYWSCSITTHRDGDEQIFSNTGASIYWAIHAAVEDAKKKP